MSQPIESKEETTTLQPGALLAVPLPDGRFGGAQVLAVTPTAVAVRLLGVVLACAPESALDFADAPVAVDHVAVARHRVSEAVVGRAPLPAEALAGSHARWRAAGERPVVDAPLAVLVGALLAD